jgi:hypothetical protein
MRLLFSLFGLFAVFGSSIPMPALASLAPFRALECDPKPVFDQSSGLRVRTLADQRITVLYGEGYLVREIGTYSVRTVKRVQERVQISAPNLKLELSAVSATRPAEAQIRVKSEDGKVMNEKVFCILR